MTAGAAQPLSTCTVEALGGRGTHALVYGRCKLWYRGFDDNNPEFKWHWSRYAWWKALHYGHRGPPSRSATWGIYAGSADMSITGPGDAEISHWLPVPDVPEGAETNK